MVRLKSNLLIFTLFLNLQMTQKICFDVAKCHTITNRTFYGGVFFLKTAASTLLYNIYTFGMHIYMYVKLIFPIVNAIETISVTDNELRVCGQAKQTKKVWKKNIEEVEIKASDRRNNNLKSICLAGTHRYSTFRSNNINNMLCRLTAGCWV